jgi:hypothetical protein
MTINFKTAKVFGLAIALAQIASADEVIGLSILDASLLISNQLSFLVKSPPGRKMKEINPKGNGHGDT